MKYITLVRSDFKNSQDYPNESFFEGILLNLGFAQEQSESIDEIELTVLEVSPSPDES